MTSLHRFVYTAFIALLLAVVAHGEAGECATPGECANPDVVASDAGAAEAEDPSCPSRAHVIRCAGQVLDTNNNGKLERDELQTAIDKLPWYSRGILQILGSVDKMMKKCDMDGDDAISMDFDMEQNKEQCLATCFKRRAFKGAFFPDCE